MTSIDPTKGVENTSYSGEQPVLSTESSEVKPSIFTGNRETEEATPVYSEGDRLIRRTVNGEEDREIRIGRDSEGNKFRYTDDTHESLVTVSTEGKNTYLTKAEFDRQVKEILRVDRLPSSVKAEYRQGSIVFVDTETGNLLSSSDLHNNYELRTLQRQKEINDYAAEHQEEWNKQAQESFYRSVVGEVSIGFTQEDIDRMHEITDKIRADQIALWQQQQAEQASKSFSDFKIDQSWYTAQGVRSLEREWSNLAPVRKGFTHEFYQGIVNIAKEVHCDPDNLMSILNSESSFEPNIPTGLMGFIESTRENYNIDPTTMTPVQQLPYIRKCIVEGKQMVYGKKGSNKDLSPGELYSLVYLPGRLRTALATTEHILTRKNEKAHPEFYRDNAPLDKDGKGYITVENMAQRIEDFNAYSTTQKYNMAYRGDRHNKTYIAPDNSIGEVVVVGQRPKPIDDTKLAKGEGEDDTFVKT